MYSANFHYHSAYNLRFFKVMFMDRYLKIVKMIKNARVSRAFKNFKGNFILQIFVLSSESCTFSPPESQNVINKSINYVFYYRSIYSTLQ